MYGDEKDLWSFLFFQEVEEIEEEEDFILKCHSSRNSTSEIYIK